MYCRGAQTGLTHWLDVLACRGTTPKIHLADDVVARQFLPPTTLCARQRCSKSCRFVAPGSGRYSTLRAPGIRNLLGTTHQDR